MRILFPAAGMAVLGLLAGCNQPGFGPEGAGFGNAVRQNIAVQTVNPEPTATPSGGFDGTRATLMQGRYKVDKVEPPKSVSTSTIGLGEE